MSGHKNIEVVLESTRPDDGFDDKTRKELAMIFYRIAADQFVLAGNYLNFEKNVLGPHHTTLRCMWNKILLGGSFNPETVEPGLVKSLDMITDYIRSLGAKVPVFTEFAKVTRLPLPPEGKWISWKEMVEFSLKSEETLIRHLMEDRKRCLEFKDDIGEDLIDRIIRCHKRYATYLRAHVERE